MSFFKKIFGNKPEDESSGTEGPAKNQPKEMDAQTVKAKDVSGSRGNRSRVGKDEKSTTTPPHSKPSLGIPVPSGNTAKKARPSENKQHSSETAQQAMDGPKQMDNVINFKPPPKSPPPPVPPTKKVSPPELKKEIPQSDKASRDKKTSSDIGTTQVAGAKVSIEHKQPSKSETHPEKTKQPIPPQPSEKPSPKSRIMPEMPDTPADSTAISSKRTMSRASTSYSTPSRPDRTLLSAKVRSAISNEGKSPQRQQSESRPRRSPMRHSRQRSVPPKDSPIDPRDAMVELFQSSSEDWESAATKIETLKGDQSKHDELQNVFMELATHHAEQIRALSLELSLGLTPKNRVKPCREKIQIITRVAEKVNQVPLSEALKKFDEQLEQGLNQIGTHLSTTLISELNTTYHNLIKLMPEVFSTGDVIKHREPLLVEALLQQVPNVKKNIIKKLQTNSRGTYRMICDTKAEVVARKAGIDLSLAEAIIQHFNAFQKRREQLPPEEYQSTIFKDLSRLSEQLKHQQAIFCEADAKDDSKRKREIRQERETTLVDINLLLAEIGRVELIQQLLTLPVERKLLELEQFLSNSTVPSSTTNHISQVSQKAIQ